ncbi:MAG: FAD-binding protein, partial [Clostridia bacterium]|nr:FAD-binding protein [Clostridia bacterium]
MKENKNISRRNFLKGAAVGAAGLAAMGLTGCSGSTGGATATPTAAPVSTAAPATTTVTIAQVAQLNSNWLEDEPAITTIAETITCEALVIGGGTAGLECGASLAEKGIDTLIIEQNADASTLRNDFGSINSTYQQEAGTVLDKKAIMNYHVMQNA